MFVLFISDNSNRRRRRQLSKHQGGGGGGKGTGGGTGGGKGGGKNSKTKTSSITSRSGMTRKTSTYGNSGTISAGVIPMGQPFAGRTEGGGTRAQIFGTRTYGSGYPGYSPGRGVAGRGFPFVYWPIAWPLTVGGGLAAAYYLHGNEEYGTPTNTSRPGGALAYAIFPSNSSNSPTVIFRLLSDNATVFSLIEDLTTNCTSYLSTSASPPNSLSNTTSAPTPFIPPYMFSNTTTGPANPQPEQVVQYYRASTIALTLDSYNNSATYSNDTNTPDSLLPMLSKADTDLLLCLNTTIGLAAPLVSGGGGSSRAIFSGIAISGPWFFVFWFMWWWIGV